MGARSHGRPRSRSTTMTRRARAIRALLAFAAVVAAFLATAPAALADNDSINDPFFLESDYDWRFNNYTAANYGEEPADEPGTANGDDVGCPFLMEQTSWYEFQGTGGRMTITTAEDQDLATTIDSQMAVYVRNSQGQLEPVACNDDPGPQIFGAEVPLANTEFRRRYFVQVGRLDSDNTGTSTDDVLEIVAIANAVPSNDNRADALEIASGPDETYENLGATLEDNEGEACGFDFNKSVWFRYTMPDQGSVRIDLSSPFFENALVVLYDGNSGTPLQCDTALSDFEYRIQTGDMAPRTLFIQVGAVIDPDDPEAAGWDPDEGLFGLQLVFTVDSDYDDDGVPNGSDRCPRTPGTNRVRDCPDPDNDAFADTIDDRCPGLGGRDADRHQGCPDEDADGVPEGPGGRDACPGISPPALNRGDANGDGCPDPQNIHNSIKLSRSVIFVRGGIRLLSFAVTGVPRGARVQIICRLPNGRRCGGVLIRRASARAQAARTVRPRNLQGDRIPFGTKITTRVTAPYATGSFVRFTAKRNARGFTERYFCINSSGSKKPRPIRRGCR